MANIFEGVSVGKRGCQLIAAFILSCCAAAWCVQLGGVASLQAACSTDLKLGLNSVDTIRDELQQLQLLILSINPAGPASAAVMQAGLAGTATVLAQLTGRSTSVFTFTPDESCSTYYRYQWLNVALQFTVLALAFFALFLGFLHHARVAICSLLVVSSVLAIENAQTFFHVRQYATGLTLTRGYVFFAGCVATCAANLLLLFVLGIHNEHAVIAYDARTDGRESHSELEFPLGGGGGGKAAKVKDPEAQRDSA